MRHSFYHFALTYRGGAKGDNFSMFAEAMFLDHTFPKQSESFDELSRYIEEAAHDEMSAIIFDDFWVLYAENEK
ncbi:MAG: YozE family protein [Kurthia sp.]|nr:YozE family protein [Candidatus Kurthia equi]